MYIFFADDSIQNHPSRVGVGQLVAVGGLFVDCEQVASLERSIDYICRMHGFPPGEEFKWSPRANSWMHRSLTNQCRQEFFSRVIRTCADHSGIVTVLISDTTSRKPSNCASHSEFVTKMLIERVNWLAKSRQTSAFIVADRPGGGGAQERVFLTQCLQNIQNGTGYVVP